MAKLIRQSIDGKQWTDGKLGPTNCQGEKQSRTFLCDNGQIAKDQLTNTR